MTQARAQAKFVGMSAQKVRLMVDLVRGRRADEALTMLKFMPNAAAKPVAKVLRTAIANADIRAEARGPSGMLMPSTPKWCSRRADASSLDGDTPRGDTSSTSVTNSPRTSLVANLDFSVRS